MFGEHNCVRSFYVNATDNFTNKMQQKLALLVAELLMQFKNFRKFANLLSSLYLLLKENTVTQAIFDEMWKVCDLPSLLLIKVAVTRWFSKNIATLCDLDWWDLLLQHLTESINVNVNYLHQDNMMIIFLWLYYNEYKYISCIRLN